MPSSDENSPPESFDASLVATIPSALATAGAIIFTLDLLRYSRRPEVSDFSFARPELELRHIFIRLTALVVLGYVTNAIGGRELIVKGRLAFMNDFMKELTRLSNPRFGVDRTIGLLMERWRAFQDADVCILVMSDPSASSHHLRCLDRRDTGPGVAPEPPPEELQQCNVPTMEHRLRYSLPLAHGSAPQPQEE